MARAPVWLAVAVLMAAVDGAAAATLQPHRAAYNLGLAGAQGAPLSEVRGGLVIEWQRACDGWLSRQRLGFVATTEDGGSFSHDVRFSSWEALDGSRLRYSVRSFQGEEIDEEYRGEASLENGAGVARFSEPERQNVPLPAGTVFPTAHLNLVLSGAAEGRQILTHEVFDGWGFDSLTQITSVIGRGRQLDEDREGAADDGPTRAWPVSMAYYNLERDEDLPEFEAEFLLLENGVLRELVLDYGDFRLDASLHEIELLAGPDC